MPILISNEVYQGYKREKPNDDSIVKEWWSKQYPAIPEHNGDVYGGDITYTDADDL
jgi:hypothetical protein